ncbi:MAG: glycosyltransferase [candidate division NC10 bacterium]|nr:glycosyltransferase [candidate division NC10 bacterium]
MTSGARLRIAFVTDTYDIGTAGGVLSARRFVTALRERHDITLVTAGKQGEGRVALSPFYVPPFGGTMRKMGFVFAVPKRRVLEETFRRVDVVHVQFPFWLGIQSATIARRLGTPLVAASHVQPQNLLYNINLRSQALSDWIYRFFVRALYDRADMVVCPSRFALEELRRHGLRAPAR